MRGEIAKLVNYDQAQVDGWSNYRVPWATLGSKASPIWSHAFDVTLVLKRLPYKNIVYSQGT